MYAAIYLICLGFIMIWLPLPLNRKAKRHLERLEELDAGAEEAFFDEHRTLKANPPTSNPWRVRAIGGALMIGGLIQYFGLFS